MSERMLDLFKQRRLDAQEQALVEAVRDGFSGLAQWVSEHVPSGPERTVALRKLLEGKDAAVRAVVFSPLERKHGSDGILESVGEQSREERFEILKAALVGAVVLPKDGGVMGNDIGWAVARLWDGRRVARKGWNGRGMWLELQEPGEGSKMTLPYVYMKTADGKLVPWVCSQTDLLAFDWETVGYEGDEEQ